MHILLYSSALLYPRILFRERLTLGYTLDELFSHLIELRLQLANFVALFHRHLLRVVTTSELGGGFYQSMNALDQASRSQLPKKRADRSHNDQPGKAAKEPAPYTSPEQVSL